jgi:hypothetical protein
MRESCKVATAAVDVKAMYRKENCWIVSDNPCASFAEGDTHCPYLFSTGVKDWPASAKIPDCDCDEIVTPVWKRLGLPEPLVPTVESYSTSVAETVEFGIKRDRKRDARAWQFAYLDSEGREGPLSPVSEVVDSMINGSATIRIPADNFDPSFDVVGIRLYRVVSLSADGAQTATMDSGPLYVKDFVHKAGGNYTVVDSVKDDQLGYEAPSEKYFAPPANLEGLISLPNGVLVGFEGKNLWFSEPWEYHAWNCYLNLDDCIKKIMYSSGSIYVTTDGHPYVISEKGTDVECRCCREVVRYPLPMPIRCPQSMVETTNGVMWATDDGLARMTGASLVIATDNYIDRASWATFRPETVRATYYKGAYYGFTDMAERMGIHDGVTVKGFIFDVNEDVYGAGDAGSDSNFTTHDIPAWTTFITRDGALYVSYGKEIRRWEGGAEPMFYVWRSQVLSERGYSNYAAARVIGEHHFLRQPIGREVQFTLYVDGRVMFTRRIKDSQPFRLPSTRYGLDYEIEIRGFSEVNEVHLATSMQELTLINNS